VNLTMRGGHRYGAGRPGWRRKCEQKMRLDIRQVAAKGRLVPGAFSWSWNRDGEPAGSITLSIDLGVSWATFIYSRTKDDQRTDFKDAFKILYTPCNYGGQRPWFECRWCQQRCAVLYGLSGDGHFGCRKCLRLAYTSEALSPEDRAGYKMQKLESLLWGPNKKPRRQRTTDRLIDRLMVAEDRREDLMAPSLARLLARLDPEFGKMLKEELGERLP
jgi:hypothetical protein